MGAPRDTLYNVHRPTPPANAVRTTTIVATSAVAANAPLHTRPPTDAWPPPRLCLPEEEEPASGGRSADRWGVG